MPNPVIVIETLRGTADIVNRFVRRKLPSACPYPDQFVSHGFRKTMIHNEGKAGVRLNEDERRELFEKILIPICLAEEEKAGGRSAVDVVMKRDIMRKSWAAVETQIWRWKAQGRGEPIQPSTGPQWRGPTAGWRNADGSPTTDPRVKRDASEPKVAGLVPAKGSNIALLGGALAVGVFVVVVLVRKVGR